MNKLFKPSLPLALLSGILVISACNRQDELIKTSTSEDVDVSYLVSMPTSSLPASIENAGVFHNEVMDHIATYSGFTSFTLAQTTEITLDYMEENEDGPEIDVDHLTSIDPQKDMSIQDMFEEHNYSEDAVALAEDFEGYLHDGYSQETTASEMISTLLDFEEAVLSAGLAESEEKCLLGASCIARYSTMYWEGVEAIESHAWSSVLDGDNARMAAEGFPAEMVAIAEDRQEEESPSLFISIRAWIDIHAYVTTYVMEKESGFDDDFAQFAASGAARAWSGWGTFMP